MAKMSPKASIRNPKSTFGNAVKNVHWMILPSNIIGTMEKIIRNCRTLASIVHPSRMFGHLPHKTIKIEAIAGHKIAKTGLIDSTVSPIMVRHTPPIQTIHLPGLISDMHQLEVTPLAR